MQNWKILIVTNGKIIDEYYQKDSCFNKNNWSFFNVGKEKLLSDKYDIINSCEIEGYEYLGKDWAESEVIYNIHKLNLFKAYEFLGIIHWDFNLYARDYDTYRITENISNILDKFKWISFFPSLYSSINGYYNVLLDERKPNCLFVRDSGLDNPKNANDYSWDLMKELGIIKEKPQDIKQDSIVPLCCSFITDRLNFDNIGKLIEKSYKSGIFEKFDIEKRHRIPGQVMERLIATYKLNPNSPTAFNFRLDHNFIGGIEINKVDPKGENY